MPPQEHAALRSRQSFAFMVQCVCLHNDERCEMPLTCMVSSKQLVLHAANWKHKPSQGQLSSHRGVSSDTPTGRGRRWCLPSIATASLSRSMFLRWAPGLQGGAWRGHAVTLGMTVRLRHGCTDSPGRCMAQACTCREGSKASPCTSAPGWEAHGTCVVLQEMEGVGMHVLLHPAVPTLNLSPKAGLRPTCQ